MCPPSLSRGSLCTGEALGCRGGEELAPPELGQVALSGRGARCKPVLARGLLDNGWWRPRASGVLPEIHECYSQSAPALWKRVISEGSPKARRTPKCGPGPFLLGSGCLDQPGQGTGKAEYRRLPPHGLRCQTPERGPPARGTGPPRALQPLCVLGPPLQLVGVPGDSPAVGPGTPTLQTRTKEHFGLFSF